MSEHLPESPPGVDSTLIHFLSPGRGWPARSFYIDPFPGALHVLGLDQFLVKQTNKLKNQVWEPPVQRAHRTSNSDGNLAHPIVATTTRGEPLT